MPSISDNLASLETLVKTVVADTVRVYTPDQFETMNKDELEIPCVALAYFGRVGREPPSAQGGNLSNGMGQDMRFGVYVIGEGIPCQLTQGGDNLLSLVQVLDNLTTAIIGQRAATYHNWLFKSEVPVRVKGTMAYLQIWETFRP